MVIKLTFRWQPLIDSGCRTGTELVRAWQVLQTEVLESVIAAHVEGLAELIEWAVFT